MSLPKPSTPVKDMIYLAATEIADKPADTSALEDKVVLSIAIRLKAEDFMISKINDESFWHGISSNQTTTLVKRFKDDFPGEKKDIRLLDQVNLMTPENIHLNSFMYEPILDLSIHHLKKLFAKVDAL